MKGVAEPSATGFRPLKQKSCLRAAAAVAKMKGAVSKAPDAPTQVAPLLAMHTRDTTIQTSAPLVRATGHNAWDLDSMNTPKGCRPAADMAAGASVAPRVILWLSHARSPCQHAANGGWLLAAQAALPGTLRAKPQGFSVAAATVAALAAIAAATIAALVIASPACMHTHADEALLPCSATSSLAY